MHAATHLVCADSLLALHRSGQRAHLKNHFWHYWLCTGQGNAHISKSLMHAKPSHGEPCTAHIMRPRAPRAACHTTACCTGATLPTPAIRPAMGPTVPLSTMGCPSVPRNRHPLPHNGPPCCPATSTMPVALLPHDRHHALLHGQLLPALPHDRHHALLHGQLLPALPHDRHHALLPHGRHHACCPQRPAMLRAYPAILHSLHPNSARPSRTVTPSLLNAPQPPTPSALQGPTHTEVRLRPSSNTSAVPAPAPGSSPPCLHLGTNAPPPLNRCATTPLTHCGSLTPLCAAPQAPSLLTPLRSAAARCTAPPRRRANSGGASSIRLATL